jgi:hypothetical protein
MKVIKSEDNLLKFDSGLKIEGHSEADCCEINYLDFENIPVGTEFPDMTVGQLVDIIKLKDDGFILKDSQETPHWVQARSEQNGYYSRLTIVYIKTCDKRIALGCLSGKLHQ